MNNKPETMMIDDVKYVREDTVRAEVVEFTGKESVATRMIGKPAIIRSYNEGINIGRVVLADESGVEIKDCRRIYYHKPADNKLAWYEGVAMSGLSKDSKVSGTVTSKIIVERYSMTECDEKVYASILEHPNVKS